MNARRPSSSGFTLVEVLVSLFVLGLLMVFTSQMVTNAGSILRRTQGDIDAFQESRAAFQQMASRLSQAVLQPYWSYDSVTAPSKYSRNSDLRFVSGPGATLTGQTGMVTQSFFFEAPIGYSANTTYQQNVSSALNVCGYWVQYGDDSASRPNFLTPNVVPLRYRFRLMEMCQPSEVFTTYNYTVSTQSAAQQGADTWFTTPMTDNASTHVLAENIIALIALPQSSPYDTNTSPASYSYDSKDSSAGNTLNYNQLPPMIQLTVVALDETSAIRLQNQSTAEPDFGLAGLFQDPTKYQSDLQALEDTLTARHLSFRVLSNVVTLPQAKWSQ